MGALTDDLNNAFSYTVGQCTRFVAGVLSWIPAGLGNAKDWYANAQAKGLPTGTTPQVGSVAVWGAGAGTSQFGHVALVTGLVPGGFTVQEENFTGGPGVTDTRTVSGNSLSGLKGFIYSPSGIHIPPIPGIGSINIGNIPVIGGAVDTGQALQQLLSEFAGLPQAIASFPANVGHGLANALSASTSNVGTFAKNNIVPLIVALVVAVVLFAT